MTKRIFSCSHNGDDINEILRRIAERMPDNWTAAIYPDGEGHPAAIVKKGELPDTAEDGQQVLMGTNSMLCITLVLCGHDDDFAKKFIKEYAGDAVTEVPEEEEKEETLH